MRCGCGYWRSGTGKINSRKGAKKSLARAENAESRLRRRQLLLSNVSSKAFKAAAPRNLFSAFSAISARVSLYLLAPLRLCERISFLTQSSNPPLEMCKVQLSTAQKGLSTVKVSHCG